MPVKRTIPLTLSSFFHKANESYSTSTNDSKHQIRYTYMNVILLECVADAHYTFNLLHKRIQLE